MYKLAIALIIFSLPLISCATQDMVIEKSLEHLNQKYNEKFREVSVIMNHDEGNYGSADLVVSPESDSTLSLEKLVTG